MTRKELVAEIKAKQSFLCVGLDVDVNKLPAIALAQNEPVKWFIKSIVEATAPYAVAYKPNFAFFEALNSQSEELLAYIREIVPSNCLLIADAKRGDIGNTSAAYAKAILHNLNYDAITIAPYMGEDSIKPFQLEGKWGIVLALTSNAGAKDLQLLKLQDGKFLFEATTEMIVNYGNSENTMLVVGATRGEDIAKVRAIAKDYFFLVPGIGAQGGSLEEVVKYGFTNNCGLLVNASRSILYASSADNFAEAAALEAQRLALEMRAHLQQRNF